MIAFIEAHRDQFGVKFICPILRAAIPGFLTSPGQRAARVRPPCDRVSRDEQRIADLHTVHQENFSVYGVNTAMKRRGWHLRREQTRRLMKKAGLRGVQQGKPVFTTVTDAADQQPADLVNSQFKAPAPNHLWVADFVRREAPFDRVEVRDHHASAFAAAG